MEDLVLTRQSRSIDLSEDKLLELILFGFFIFFYKSVTLALHHLVLDTIIKAEVFVDDSERFRLLVFDQILEDTLVVLVELYSTLTLLISGYVPQERVIKLSIIHRDELLHNLVLLFRTGVLQ